MTKTRGPIAGRDDLREIAAWFRDGAYYGAIVAHYLPENGIVWAYAVGHLSESEADRAFRMVAVRGLWPDCRLGGAIDHEQGEVVGVGDGWSLRVAPPGVDASLTCPVTLLAIHSMPRWGM
jgi:hypothetical protein